MSPRPRVSASAPYVVLFYVSLALALLAKGPPALVDIAIPLIAFRVCFRRRLPGKWLAHFAGVVLLLAIVVPWPLYVLRHVPHAMDLWRYESVGELSENTENAREWWYYLAAISYLALPWTLVWILGMVLGLARSFSRRGDLRALFPLLWYATMLIFFSFVNLKKNQYLLPAMPAQTLLIAQGLVALLVWIRRARLRDAVGTILTFQSLLAAGFASALIFMILRGPEPRGQYALRALPMVALAFVPIRELLRRRYLRWMFIQSAVYVLLFLTFWRLFMSPHEQERSAKRMASALMPLTERPGYTLMTLRLPEEVSVYLPLDVTYAPAEHVLVVIDDQHNAHFRQKRNLPEPLVQKEAFEGWVPDGKVSNIRRVPLPGATGDSRWKVYDLTVAGTGNL